MQEPFAENSYRQAPSCFVISKSNMIQNKEEPDTDQEPDAGVVKHQQCISKI